MEWEKLKVTELRDELKSRGIPLTGLKLKQQLIDKLTELDEKPEQDPRSPRPPRVHDAEVPKTQNDEIPSESLPEDQAIPNDGNHATEMPDLNGQHLTLCKTQQIHGEPMKKEVASEELDGNSTTQVSDNEERMDMLPEGLPIELKQEESRVTEVSTPLPEDAESTNDEVAMEQDNPFIPQKIEISATHSGEQAVQAHEADQDQSGPPNAVQEEQAAMSEEAPPMVPDGTLPSEPTSEKMPDLRKRKRSSSFSTVDDNDTIKKKSKTLITDATPSIRESEALRKVQEVTDAAQAIRNPDTYELQSETDLEPKSATRRKSLEASTEHSRSEIDDTSTALEANPSLHPATCSLYIRNFKRPLHVPTLRNHLSTIASSYSGDSVKILYLDNIRTHALISLTSVSAASRVRNVMHGARFPDEPMREPLWVDFIPDEKVEPWIAQESGSGAGRFGKGDNSLKRYEVIYQQVSDSIEASLQEVSTLASNLSRPGMQQSQSNRMVPQDPTASAALTSNVYQTRSKPTDRKAAATQPEHTQAIAKPPDPGRGFKALDELFDSTSTRPQLYFKLPSQFVIDDRMEMMQNLHLGHKQMGRSGDEGMKRYSFEMDERTGREGWVDKGPEFGFGRRGQDRLSGFGSSYGRGRGRGDFRGGRRGGDSWRGS